MLKEYFKEQIELYPIITEDIYNRIEFKRVWSGEMIGIGDRVLYAFAFRENDAEPKMMQILERELDNLSSRLIFERYEKGNIPVFKLI